MGYGIFKVILLASVWYEYAWCRTAKDLGLPPISGTIYMSNGHYPDIDDVINLDDVHTSADTFTTDIDDEASSVGIVSSADMITRTDVDDEASSVGVVSSAAMITPTDVDDEDQSNVVLSTLPSDHNDGMPLSGDGSLAVNSENRPSVNIIVRTTSKESEGAMTPVATLTDDSDYSDDTHSGSGSGHQENTREDSEDGSTSVSQAHDICNEHTCRYGGVCDPKSAGIRCICDIKCDETVRYPVCATDGRLFQSACEIRQASCKQQKLLRVIPEYECSWLKNTPIENKCPKAESHWMPWSPWLQAGDVDVRMRRCKVTSVVAGHYCDGERFEVRKCSRALTGTCMASNGTSMPTFTHNCKGLDSRDVITSDMVYHASHEDDDECQFSLFNAKLNTFVYGRWSIVKLIQEGNAREWCHTPNEYVAFHTSIALCENKFNMFCGNDRTCRYARQMRDQDLGDAQGDCWKEFLYQQQLPKGFPVEGNTLLCQRFSRTGVYGHMFGENRAYFATSYSSSHRIPTFSFGIIKEIADMGWPHAPYMVERALLKDFSPIPKIWQKTKRGITPEAELETHLRSDGCKMGTNQATSADYKYSGYRHGHLIWPTLAGSDAAAKVATFTLTNIAPMEHSLFTAWKHAISQINNYAITRCGIPNKSNGPATPQTLHRNSVMYVIAGTVPSDNHVIGNNVNVPSLFWLSACCVTRNGTSSFAIIAENDIESDILVIPVLQLEILLTNNYPKIDLWQSVHLFPGNNNECIQPENDDSVNISL